MVEGLHRMRADAAQSVAQVNRWLEWLRADREANRARERRQHGAPTFTSEARYDETFDLYLDRWLALDAREARERRALAERRQRA